MFLVEKRSSQEDHVTADLVVAVLPFIGLQIIGRTLVMIFPEIVLYLTRLIAH